MESWRVCRMMSDIEYAHKVLAGDIVVSGAHVLGIAMNDAVFGGQVAVCIAGSMCMPVSESEYKIKAEIGTKEYKVPTIKLEVPKIELDR